MSTIEANAISQSSKLGWSLWEQVVDVKERPLVVGIATPVEG
jgi:hypothetical protein